jgi:hypothetical protein
MPILGIAIAAMIRRAGSSTQKTGRSPSRTSRKVPPPTATRTPNTTTDDVHPLLAGEQRFRDGERNASGDLDGVLRDAERVLDRVRGVSALREEVDRQHHGHPLLPRRISNASKSIAATRCPASRSSSQIPLALLMLISVRRSPITSIPTGGNRASCLGEQLRRRSCSPFIVVRRCLDRDQRAAPVDVALARFGPPWLPLVFRVSDNL